MRSWVIILLIALCGAAATAGEPETVPISSETAITLQTALQWTLARNPDLIAQRQNLNVSAAAVRVAERFPTSLNPTVAVTLQPWVFQRGAGGEIDRLEPYLTIAWQQPIEIGNRTGYREAIARAGFTQTQWNIVQAELLALVETYRAHQTAVYRKEKWLSALWLSRFHGGLVETLRHQREANQVGPADVILAEVETQAVEQEVEAARQEYETALVGLRRRIGIAEYAASIEPAGDLQAPEPPPAESEQSLVSMAMASRPEIQAAKAQLDSARAAVSLARADRIPIPSVGPAYEKSETGESFYGIALTSPLPLLNTGKTLVVQREAECHRDAVVLDQWCQRVQTEVRSSLARWQQARRSLARSRDWARSIDAEAARMRNLYDAGQTDLVKLLEVQRRHLGAESSRLDTLWQATQAYADLLAALGAVSLLGSQTAVPE
jgi:cobalt-zinc-cadmium efflux system outer membrane protein